jgi:crotonobetainyl-CoA:carnitine CoA-transferase CaiB-like acyl-CoA transferase
MVSEVDHPQGPLKVLANPIRVDGQRLPTRAAPKLGVDTDSLLTEIGIDADTIAALRKARTI